MPELVHRAGRAERVQLLAGDPAAAAELGAEGCRRAVGSRAADIRLAHGPARILRPVRFAPDGPLGRPAPQRRTLDGSIYEAARLASPPLPSQIAMSRNEARAVVAVRNRPLTVQTVRLPTLLVPANVPSGLIATVTA